MSVDCADRVAGRSVLAGGDVIELRELRAEEEAPVLEVFAGLGACSRERRFLAPKPRLTGPDLRQLTAVDGVDHVALVAMSGGSAVGVARFARDPADPESVDAAVAVVDAWQRRGVGTALVAALVRRGREAGVRRFAVAVLRENDGVLRLMRRARVGVDRVDVHGDTIEISGTLVGDSGTLEVRR